MSSYTYKITHSFQWAALALIIACFSCIVLPALLSDGYTYSLASTDNCAKSVIVVDVVDFIVCCDPGKTTAGQQGLCIAAYDSTIKIFTSMYAYVIPFLPIFISSILYYNRCMLQSALVRARFLVILLLYRTFFLYKYLDYLEHELLSAISDRPQLALCWYHEYRACKSSTEFDTSDHIVLFICHYIIPICIEIVVVAVWYERIEPQTHGTDEVVPQKRLPVSSGRLRVMAAVSLVFALVSLRAIAYTSSYFHSLWESLAALLQCVILVIWPLYWFSTYDKRGFCAFVLGIESTAGEYR